MPAISFETEVKALEAQLTGWMRNRIPSIARNALNDTVQEARFAEMDAIKSVFDRPAPLTQRAPLYRKATRQDLEAAVFIRDEAFKGTPPVKYLYPEAKGGPRRAKRFELALRRVGIMRPNEYAIPARGTRLNQYGNVTPATITRILSQLRAFSEVGFLANETARSKKRKRSRAIRYFVPGGTRADMGISRLPRGIYERRGKKIRAVFIFVNGAPTYRKRYDFGEAAFDKARVDFPRDFQRYFYRELARTGVRKAA
jgi:hypothetical protein